MTRNNLKPIAKKIRAMEKKTIANTIEIGKLLQEVFDGFEHGDRREYHEWAESEFGWSLRTTARYRAAYDFDQKCQNGIFEGAVAHRIADLNISVSALYLLAENRNKPSLSSAIGDLLTVAHNGNRLTYQTVAANLLDDEPADEPAAADDADEPNADTDEAETDDAEPDASTETGHDDTETDADASEPPAPNELSKALEIIRDHNEFSVAWQTATKLIDAVGLQEIAETLRGVSVRYYGSDAIKEKANRADAQSRLKAQKHYDTGAPL